MTDTPLYEATVKKTQVLPDPDSIPHAELEEVRLIGRSRVLVAFLRAFGLSPTGRFLHQDQRLILATVDNRGRPHDPSNGHFIPSRRLDMENPSEAHHLPDVPRRAEQPRQRESG